MSKSVMVHKEIDRLFSHSQYEMLKVYLDQEVFENNSAEIKIGYLNINSIFNGNHMRDFNKDKNLQYLDFIVLSETWLTSKYTTDDISKQLQKWEIVEHGGRQDFDDIEHSIEKTEKD